MKRILLCFLALLLAAVMFVMPASAADVPEAALSSASGLPGRPVYMTLSLYNLKNVQSFSIVANGLTMNDSETTWLCDPMLSTVDSTHAVCGFSQVKDLNGAVATLAFDVPETLDTRNYTVSLAVKVIYTGAVNTQVLNWNCSGNVSVSNPVVSVTMGNTSATLDLSGNKTMTLTPTTVAEIPELPHTSGEVVWASSDPSVATVSNGAVTAVGLGQARITATVGGKEARCLVTVTCEHNSMKETVSAKEATCIAEGNNAYSICWCGKVFKGDGSDKVETTAAAEVLNKKDHPYSTTISKDGSDHWYACTTQNCTAVKSKEAHTLKWVVTTPPTNTAAGVESEMCETCGYVKTTRPLPHLHTMTQHDAVTATCSRVGNLEYWTCSHTDCSTKYYADANGQQELSAAQVFLGLNANKHVNTVQQGYQAPTCYQSGKNADTYCNDCSTTVVPGSVINPTGNHVGGTWVTSDADKHWKNCTTPGCSAKVSEGNHDYNWREDVPATEDTTGLMHKECDCGKKINENTVIEKLPHKHVEIRHYPAKAATCNATGNVEYWTCSSSKCTGKYYKSAAEDCTEEWDSITTPINSQNHTGGTEIRDAKSATCYTNGYTGDVWCKGCVKEIQKGSVIGATGDHVGNGVWKSNAAYHWQSCKTSGCSAEVDKKEHKFAWRVDKDATEEKTGLKHEECECGVKRNENTVINKPDHKHIGIKHVAAVPATCVKEGTLEYWTCSSPKCTGKYYGDAKCQLELATIVDPIDTSNHPKTEVKDAKEATCAKEGYSGDIWCQSCKKLVKKGTAVAATGKHTAKDGYQTDKDFHWQVCKDCDAIINYAKEEHTYTWIVDAKPTEEAAGIKHEECTACGYIRNENTAVDKLVHNPQLVYAVSATCVEDGMAEHYYCTNCGRYYASENGELGQAIDHAELAVKAAGHVYGQEWVTDAKNHWHVCECGAVDGEQAHEPELVNVVEATETEEGYTGDTVCAVCEAVLEEGEPVAVVDTEITDTPVQESTETPTEDSASQTEKKGSKGAVAAVAAAGFVAAAGAGAYLFVFKRKKFW